MYTLEKKYYQRGETQNKWSNFAINRVLDMCQIISPLYSLGMMIPPAFLNLCAAPWLGSLMLKCDQPLCQLRNILHIFLSIIQSFFSLYIICASVLSCCPMLVVILICFSRLVERLKNKLDSIPVSEGISRYKELCVLEKCMNNSYQDGCIPFLITELLLCTILALYIMISVCTILKVFILPYKNCIFLNQVLRVSFFKRNGTFFSLYCTTRSQELLEFQ